MVSAVSYLNQHAQWFPPAHQALEEPNGLLAIGGDLSRDRLLHAYRNGIFPWFNPGDPILWWSPDPRAIFDLPAFVPPRSLKKCVRQNGWHFSVNLAFDEVIAACAEPRAKQDGTWISPDMQHAYQQLHRSGHAHSVEVWQGDILVGGLYGLALGGVFCGESMFHRVSNASKAAFWALACHFSKAGGRMIDAQVPNDHLLRLGAQMVPRMTFLERLHALRDRPMPDAIWQPARYEFDV
ncbi:leucyl/phenylalanyl-tRNA--protein transferase [Ferrimonas balearica]|uniref:leucyl/phenylalanyl-tRNA--protein transferase n=1 Tax=Ferrimonas balearica TaxID=44012 RepID=UPI001C98EF93|nr:leucyl/phenylalanyl-tRNA--protein transferase [Ferrimonas balearica]MBY5920328.1 leucyl/phenylalanyl-tRNA--protein transferase [Ferrimonas balearica]MBY5996987.1 leucyl/phenylalanyl-tRNA--protein transferase [Ferrimonas balearica]